MRTQRYMQKESISGTGPRRLPSLAFAPDLLYDIIQLSVLERPTYSTVVEHSERWSF